MAKPTIVLSINAGSSSVKVTVFAALEDHLQKIVAAEISGLGASSASQFSYSRNGQKKTEELPNSIKGHNDAFQYILESFFDDHNLNPISSRDQINYACHRVVHGVSLSVARKPESLGDADCSNRVITQSRSW
jgi:acetate kinase